MEDRYVIPSLDRAFQVLEVLGGHYGGLSLADLGRITNIPKSSLFRILMTLKMHRAVVVDESERTFRLGSRLLELGSRYLDQFEIYRAAYDHMRLLAEACGETVFLGQLEDGEVVYTRRVESRQSVTAVRKLGHRAPAHCTATGIGMMAYLPEKEVEHLLDEHGMKPYNRSTITDRRALSRRLGDVRRLGYAVVDGEFNSELLCISAPVIDHLRRPRAALTVAMLSSQKPAADRVSEIGGMVRDSARALSLAGGFPDRHAGGALHNEAKVGNAA